MELCLCRPLEEMYYIVVGIYIVKMECAWFAWDMGL